MASCRMSSLSNIAEGRTVVPTDYKLQTANKRRIKNTTVHTHNDAGNYHKITCSRSHKTDFKSALIHSSHSQNKATNFLGFSHDGNLRQQRHFAHFIYTHGNSVVCVVYSSSMGARAFQRKTS